MAQRLLVSLWRACVCHFGKALRLQDFEAFEEKSRPPRYRSTMERMSSVAERLRSLQMDDEEAQRLQLLRRAEAGDRNGSSTIFNPFMPAAASAFAFGLLNARTEGSDGQALQQDRLSAMTLLYC